MDLKAVLDFLSELKENNNKPWFDQHRSDYEFARAQFESLVGRLIDEFSSFMPLGGVEAKDCVMRIYRDVRFARDKSPYRTNFGASIGPGGRKSSSFSYYLHLAAQNESMLAGGLYDPTAEQLAAFRTAIDRNAASFKAVVGNPDFQRYYGTVSGERLKTVPQGYTRDHPEIELLRLKQVLAMHSWSDEAVVGPDFTGEVVTAARAMKPFLDYLNTYVAGA